jgi:MFS family permease
VIAVFFVHGFLFASWTAHIPELQQHLGLSDGRLGLALFGAPIGSVLAMAVAARILPRVGSRKMVRLALLGYCVSGPFIGLTGSFGTFFVAFLLWGFFQGMLDVSMNTQAITVERFSGRVLMPGFHGSWSCGALVGAVTGASAVALGLSLSGQLLILAVPCMLVVGWLSTRMIPDREVGDNPESWRGSREGRHGVFQGELIVLGGIAFADMLCEGAAADWAAVYLRNSMHTVPLVAGMGFAIYALAMLAVRLSGNRLFSRFAAHRLLPLLAVIATLGFAGGLVIARPASVLAGFALLGAGLGSVVPMTLRALSGGQREHWKGGRLGGRVWLGRLRRGTGRDRRDRIIDDTAHGPVPDPSAHGHGGSGNMDGEGGAALRATCRRGTETTGR